MEIRKTVCLNDGDVDLIVDMVSIMGQSNINSRKEDWGFNTKDAKTCSKFFDVFVELRD